MADKRPRCFKCLAFGRSAHNSTGPSREGCCRRCGAEGHFAVSYKADETTAVLFQKQLDKEERKGLDSDGPPTTKGQSQEQMMQYETTRVAGAVSPTCEEHMLPNVSDGTETVMLEYGIMLERN